MFKKILLFILFTNILNAQGLSFSFENDAIFNDDKHYSNRFSFAYLSTKQEVLEDNTINNFINKIPFIKHNTKYQSFGYKFTHIMFTPEDTQNTNKISNDIPYAGILRNSFDLYKWNETYFHKYSIIIGAIGPITQSEKLQNGLHHTVGANKIKGWDNQLGNDFIYGINYNFAYKLIQKNFKNNIKFELVGDTQIDLTNTLRGVIFGTNLRYGYNIPNNFSTSGIMFGDNADKLLNLESKKNKNFGIALNYGLFYNHIEYLYISEHDKSYTRKIPNVIKSSIVGISIYLNDYTFSFIIKNAKDADSWGTFSLKKVF